MVTMPPLSSHSVYMMWLETNLGKNLILLFFKEETDNLHSSTIARIVDGEDDDIKDDADKIDTKTEEDWFLTLSSCNTPHQAGQEEDIVHQVSISSPVPQSSPGYQNKVNKEHELQVSMGKLQ